MYLDKFVRNAVGINLNLILRLCLFAADLGLKGFCCVCGAGLAKALLVVEAWYVSLVAVGKLYLGH